MQLMAPLSQQNSLGIVCTRSNDYRSISITVGKYPGMGAKRISKGQETAVHETIPAGSGQKPTLPFLISFHCQHRPDSCPAVWTWTTRRLAALEVHTFQNCDLIGFPPTPFLRTPPGRLTRVITIQTMSRFRHQKKPEQAYLAHPHQIAQLWRIASTRAL